MSVLVDTNILLRRAQVASEQHRLVLDSLIELVRADISLCLVPQVIYEFWVAATRPIDVNGLGVAVPQAELMMKELLQDFVLLRDERGIFGNWQSLVVDYAIQGKRAHDARLVAAMQKHGISNVLTFNIADFSRFPGIQVFTPSDVMAGRLPQ